MSDVWAAVAALDATTQERLADVLETRGADPQQQALRQAFLADVPFPARARVLDVGCGTGVLTRRLARLPAVETVVGVDPAPTLLARARELAADLPNVTFQEADGRSLPFGDEAFDVVVFDSTLSHVPEPEGALAEAHRVPRPSRLAGGLRRRLRDDDSRLGGSRSLQACVDTRWPPSTHLTGPPTPREVRDARCSPESSRTS